MEVIDQREVHYSCSAGIKDTNILHDLLLIIKCITQGEASVSFKTVENNLECSIDVSTNLPEVRVFYNTSIKTVSENDFCFLKDKRLEVNENNLKTVIERKNVELTKKIEDVLHDLLVLTEFVNNGGAFISRMMIENVFVFMIDVSDCQPCLILFYKNHVENLIQSESPFIPTENIEDIILAKQLENRSLIYLEDVLNSSNHGFISQSNNDQALSSFTCQKLKLSLEIDKKNLERIKRGEKPYMCVNCGILLRSLKTHGKIHEGRVCKSCKESFPCIGTMQRHEKMHSEKELTPCICCGKKFSCTYCGKSCKTKSEKQIHERSHTGEKPYSCTYCNKTFTANANKQLHERRHTGERPYVCTYCDETFTTNSKKLIHERIHTGEKPYICSYCDKTFRILPSKRYHERSHTGERPYACNFCDKTFKSHGNKRLHERTHTGERPYACAYCDKTFKSNAGKQKHEKIHTREKPCAWKHCNKMFTTKNNKQVRERVHTNEKLYPCNCNKSFITNSL